MALLLPLMLNTLSFTVPAAEEKVILFEDEDAAGPLF